ncbi:MAG: VOC family protein, partial [Anderseniella sp.]|nr:VOC family protein [Anderseniella sp.]
AYVHDPDGNNIEAVNHGPVTRSVEAVIRTPASGG